MFYVYIEIRRKIIQLLLNKTTPHFQLLPMSKADQSLLRIHEAPPLQSTKSQRIQRNPETLVTRTYRLNKTFSANELD